jgi:hypothetical protein
MVVKQELNDISIEEAIEFFRGEGMEFSQEEAELIVEFLSKLTVLVIREYFDKE